MFQHFSYLSLEIYKIHHNTKVTSFNLPAKSANWREKQIYFCKLFPWKSFGKSFHLKSNNQKRNASGRKQNMRNIKLMPLPIAGIFLFVLESCKSNTHPHSINGNWCHYTGPVPQLHSNNSGCKQQL